MYETAGHEIVQMVPPPLTVTAPEETSDALKKFIILELILILNSLKSNSSFESQ